jgi:hypothetical protein
MRLPLHSAERRRHDLQFLNLAPIRAAFSRAAEIAGDRVRISRS